MKKIGTTLFCVALAALTYAGGTAHSLTVGEGFVDPLGFHDSTPTFSWKLPVGVEKQTAYRIEVRGDEIVWNSGWVESDQSVFVPYGGKPLASRQALQWRVMFRDQEGKDSNWSKTATFELGLLSSKDWKAQWIRPVIVEAEAATEFKLIKALYRSKANPDHKKDVTGLLQKKIKNKSLTVNVNNEVLGGDPAPGEPKELEVTYQVDGKEETRVLNENKKGTFPASKMTEEPVAYLKREFPVSGKIKRARLYVTARGVFEISLNGEKVGSDHFANGWTSYANRLDTLTYDVTQQLQAGDNEFMARVGMGWYAGHIGFGGKKEKYGKHPELLLQLEITHEDGSVETLVSDGKWQGTFEGPILESSIYHGETYDARKKTEGWGAVVANPELGAARLIPKPFAPVRATEALSVQAITEPEPGRYVFDLGQNMVGWAKIHIPVEKDQTTILRFAEMLKKDGTLYTANYRAAKSTDYYTAAKTGTIEWEPRFTFHGFRYVELSGLPKGATPQKDWVTGVVLHSDLPKVGRFESSHEKLNQLQSNITWGQRGNFLDIPTDCPQRNERLGWTGDAQVFVPTSMFNYDCHAFWKSWLGSMRDDQFKDGRIPHVIPNMMNGGDSPGWMDAATFIPWDVYVRTGDTDVLEDNLQMMERLVGYYRSQATKGLIMVKGKTGLSGFGDWLQPYAPDRKGDTPLDFLTTAYYARSTQILADSLRVLEKNAEADQYTEEAAFIRQAFAKHFFDADGKLQNAPETQTAYLVAFEFDLIPAALQEKATAHLVRLVGEADGHLRTGFLGTPLIARVLDRKGHADLAFDVLFKETYPSWFYSINQGATTLWERWNSYSHEDGFGPAGMNSFNHYAYGAIGQWMYERVAGLAPDPAHPGYKHFFVRPVVGGPLTWANAELETAYGKASSGWKKVDGKLIMGVTVPPNTTATIEFPNGRKSETVPAGNYRFEIKTDFVNPPSDTRPGCYWYWINDNISKEGITKDLEAMARVGIGRAYIGHIYNYKAESNNPVDKTPVGDVAFMSDAWWEAVQWAVKEADRCGVEIGFFNSPGWSQSGGPWVTPSQTMRYLDGSETIIKGGRRIERQLPIPEIKTYPESRSTQAVQIGDLFTENDFQDVGVIAFRQPASEALDLDMSQIKLSSPGIKSLTNLFDGSQETSVEIEKQEVIDFVLDKSVVLQSLRLDPLSQLYTVDIVVEHSEDGNIYRELAKYSEERGFQGPRRKDPILVPFPATNAKYLRVKISANKAVSFSEIALSRRAVLANYIRKQLGDLSPSSRPQWNAYAWKGQDILVADSLLNSTEMIDLSDKMDASGRLVWDAPEGNWVVMRLGMVPIGTVCAPASPESRGLEVDKMSREHIRSSFDGMVGEFLRRTPASERKALKYVIADSYETGPQNWTDGMTEKFEKRFGYSPLRFLPCLTGRVVDNPKISNRFLWDWRHLVAESIAEDYVGGLRDVGAENGLTLWLENYGHWGYASEFLLYGKYSDQVGGEFWENNDPVENVECRAAASCSHIYGRKDVYAEAFTSNRNFKQSPASIKSWCDWVYGAGVNHLILHVYIHQPEEETPGIIQWFGMAFNRHNTWFEQSKGFLDYTRRCSVMLKAGLPVIDVAYYIGENSPVMQGPRNPEIPDGYDFDYINSDVLINNATVKNGKIIIPGGLEYSVLVLPKQSIMRPQVVEAINRLIQTGATVLGPKPETSPSLENYPACDESVGKISGVIWGNVDGEKIKIRKHGKGFISDGMSLEEIFARQGLEPDISVISGDGLVCAAAGAGNKIGIGKKGGIVFKHRRTMEGDVYFLSNTSEKPVDFTASFRITGRKPALWNAVTGAIDNVDAFVQKDGRTLIPLHLEASESVFVVFEGLISKAATGTAESNEPVYQTTAELNGDWTVIFNGQNPPQKIHFDKLTDWTEHSNEEIKYYAGTAAYQKSFMLPESAANKPVVLELGKVGVIADVVVNGKEVGIVWTAPWEIDISEFISMGKNELEIRVTNVWNNRLIADSNLTGEKRQTYVSQPYRFTESDPLIKSGLLGPVRIKVKR